MVHQAFEDVRSDAHQLRHAAERAPGIMASERYTRFCAVLSGRTANLVYYPAWVGNNAALRCREHIRVIVGAR